MSQFSSLVEMLDYSGDKYSKRTAIVFGAKSVTYRELNVTVNRLAQGLLTLGVKKDDRIALWLANCPEFVYSFFAVLKLGATVVPINSMLTREETKFIVEDSQSSVLICSIDKVASSENIMARVASLNQLVSLPKPQASGDNLIDFYELIKKNREFIGKVGLESDSLAEIIYTSGTTGTPKGACLTHRNLLTNVSDCSLIIKVTKADCFICLLPLFHSFASTVCMILPIFKGAKIVIMRTVTPFKRVLRTIFKHRVTVFAAVPSIYSILTSLKVSKISLLIALFINPVRLCISGAAALPYEVWEKFVKRFRRKLLQGYGLTEASPVVSLNPLTVKANPHSVGVFLPSVEGKVVDQKGNILKLGQIGELIVKGPNVMQRYFNKDKETKQTLKDGWLYTGDLAKIDERGFLYIIGRLKEMINVRGFNVYPREIEEVLYKHSQVKEAAVVGVNHKNRGEVPIAFVVVAGDISCGEITRYLRQNLAAYKVPLKIVYKSQLPKNNTGKILKRDLYQEVKNTFSADS
ncbi:MAG: long-chain fatty acid--CoA ligase [Candidatus Omnitrophica bacterium]|nr:long-chain fatty acid--CoA ligase [Candidatus Omnitrophota bacterium]